MNPQNSYWQVPNAVCERRLNFVRSPDDPITGFFLTLPLMPPLDRRAWRVMRARIRLRVPRPIEQLERLQIPADRTLRSRTAVSGAGDRRQGPRQLRWLSRSAPAECRARLRV